MRSHGIGVKEKFFNAVGDNNASVEITREHNGTRTVVN
jgi:hypothetical protein